MTTGGCPHCDYEKSTILPASIPYRPSFLPPIITTPGACLTGLYVGKHMSKKHPHYHQLLRIGDLEEHIRWYFAQDYLPLKERYEEMEKEEAIAEVVSIIQTGRSMDNVLCPDHKRDNHNETRTR